MVCWSRFFLLTMATSVMALPGAALAQSNAPSGFALERGTVQQLNSVLVDEAAPARDRDEAARRLVLKKTPESHAVLKQALENLGPDGQLAVARALSSDPAPDPDYIVPLFALLGANRNTTQAAAQALGTFKDNPGVLERLSTEASNVSRSETTRVAVIRAIGAIPSKRSARFLVEDLLMRDDQALPVRDAAADALGDMTGLTENERDLQRWGQWWRSVAELNDAAFRGNLVNSRAARYDEAKRQFNQLVDSLQKILSAQYQASAEAQKPELMLRFLRSDQAVIRATGAGIVVEDATSGTTTPPPAVRQQLRDMIPDSDPRVRLEVARAIRYTNDPEALDALLQQLNEEAQVDVRVALVQAVAGINDTRAVPALIQRLSDPANRVVEATADALGTLGAPLRDKDVATYQSIGQALLKVLDARANQPEAVELRTAVARALARVPTMDMLGVFQRLLQRPQQPATVRLQAFRALGALADARASATIVNFLLDERDASVRLEGVKALGTMAKPADAPVILKLLSSSSEPDASVRQWAWNAFLNILTDPDADVDQLAQWDQRFNNEPERRVPILQALVKKLQADKNERQLAFKRQTLGEVDDKLGRFDEAVANQKLALEYFLAQGENQEALVATTGLIRSMLRGKQYTDAATFAAQSIQRDVSQQQVMGSAIRQEAERLREANELKNAVDLIDAVETMTPPLAAQYLEPLRGIARDLRPRLPRDANGTTTRTGPQSRGVLPQKILPSLGVINPSP